MSSSDGFTTAYCALLTTLVETYQDKTLAKHRQNCQAESVMDAVRDMFWQDLNQHEALVLSNDEKLFSLDIKSLNRLTINDLWTQNKLSTNSKKYIWGYLADLIRKARPHDAPVDIRPLGGIPPNTDMIGSINAIYQNLPPSILDNVKRVADKYGQKIESGEESIDNIKFDQISKELFSNMNKDELNSLVNEVGGMLQSIMKKS